MPAVLFTLKERDIAHLDPELAKDAPLNRLVAQPAGNEPAFWKMQFVRVGIVVR